MLLLLTLLSLLLSSAQSGAEEDEGEGEDDEDASKRGPMRPSEARRERPDRQYQQEEGKGG